MYVCVCVCVLKSKLEKKIQLDFKLEFNQSLILHHMSHLIKIFKILNQVS